MQEQLPSINGRVERFFGTLKQKLNQWDVDSLKQLGGALIQFRFWYNHVRPHQHLDGRIPAEVWQGKNIFTHKIKKDYFFEAWDGLLTGYFLKICPHFLCLTLNINGQYHCPRETLVCYI